MSKPAPNTQLSIRVIQELLERTPFEQLPAALDSLSDDQRQGVRQLVARWKKRLAHEERERSRVLQMYAKAQELSGGSLCLGIDEVGRGPIAGPLTVCAVALPASPVIWGLNDSKALSAQRREELAAQIKQHAVALGIAHVQPGQIDAHGMAWALRFAMQQAIANSGINPDCVLLDGNPMHIHPREVSVVHGDALVSCIAAASIVAKVTRDAIMTQAATRYPAYGFDQSKGYGSAAHIAAIREHGLTDFHRASFCRNFI